MISKDESIVTQVAAKIASDLTNTTQLEDRSVASVQSAYLQHYDFVVEVLRDTHGFSNNTGNPVATQTPVAINVSPETIAIQNVQQAFPSAYESSGIVVKGAQHGPLPAWLTDACRKAGVTAVYDNRDTANAENRRPLFKAADGKTNAKGQPVAFWAPK